MVATVQQIIAVINPDLYCENKEEVKKILKEQGFQKAAEKAKPIAYKDENGVEAVHKLIYNSSTETLEPVYFWLLDLMTETFGLKPEKLVDNFTSTPGGGHFFEMGTRATRMQEEGMKILGGINNIISNILRIVYDLRDFKIRLNVYDEFHASKKEKNEAAKQALKQIWLDKVDIQRGQGSIHMMSTGSLQFTTLRDAFLVVNDESLKGPDGKEIDLNERVKRILKARIQEFNIWANQSEQELRKRYQIQKTYLKSQVNTLKLYTRWAKPYLRAAQDLQQKEAGRSPALVKAFDTIVLELTLLGKRAIDIEASAYAGSLPRDFMKMKPKRDYYSIVLVDFTFRGIPNKVGQHYAFGGQVEVTFRGYSLNKEELNKIDIELDNSDLGDALKLIEGTTTESLEQMQKDIDYFLEDKTEEENIEEKKKSSSGANPFLALIGQYNKEENKKEEKPKQKQEQPIKKDDWIEKQHFRKLTGADAVKIAFLLFNIYKKAHGMPNFDIWPE